MWSAGNDDGFTLLEMLIVIALLGLMIALSAPSIGNSLSGLQLSTGTRRLSAILRNVRSNAIAEKKNYKVVFNPEEGSYTYQTNSGNKAVLLPAGIEIAKLVELDEDVSGNAAIYFYPKGNSSGGRIILTNEKEQVFRIDVEAVSGRVKIKHGAEDE